MLRLYLKAKTDWCRYHRHTSILPADFGERSKTAAEGGFLASEHDMDVLLQSTPLKGDDRGDSMLNRLLRLSGVVR